MVTEMKVVAVTAIAFLISDMSANHSDSHTIMNH